MDYTYIKILVDILIPSEIDSYEKWLDIGKCLADINVELLDIWIFFNEKNSSLYDREYCVAVWNKFIVAEPKYSICTLNYLAKCCNSVEFGEMKNFIRSETLKNINCSFYEVAQLVDEEFKYCLRYVAGDFYYFNGRWSKLANIDGIYDSMIKILGTGQLANRLSDFEFRCGVSKCLRKLVYCDKVMDDKRNLICFENGVWDTDYFRLGYPDDQVSLSVGYDNVSLKMNRENVLNRNIVPEINSYLDNLMQSSDDKNILLGVLADAIFGSYNESELYVLVGYPITLIIRFMEFIASVFGEYFGYAGNSVIVNGKYDRCEFKRGVRLYLLDQVSETDICTTKYLEQFNSRNQLYKGEIYRPQFKTFLISDMAPTINSLYQNKVHQINFNPTFLSNMDNIMKYQDKFPLWKGVFMSMLIDYKRNIVY